MTVQEPGMLIFSDYRALLPMHYRDIILQGHPMDLVLKISVLQAYFCWLGDVEVMICPSKERVAGEKTVEGV